MHMSSSVAAEDLDMSSFGDGRNDRQINPGPSSHQQRS